MRTQIALSPTQHARAKSKAADLGITMAEYIRRLVDRDLDQQDPVTDPSVIIGLGSSGGSDIATERREAIGRAVAEHHSPARR